jgi:hypothetical protein
MYEYEAVDIDIGYCILRRSPLRGILWLGGRGEAPVLHVWIGPLNGHDVLASIG